MRGNSFGKAFHITTFGESHGEALGVVIDGVPPGITFYFEHLCSYLERRAPGRKNYHTSRAEKDFPEVLSGVFENKTLGTPIAVIVRNHDQRSKDYDKLKDQYRPGHADQTTVDKFGIRDHRGGGRSSGRETVSRVIAGYFAKLVVSHINIEVRMTQIGELTHFTEKELEHYLLKIKEQHDSVGGTVEVSIENIDKGLGEPVFDKLKADLAKAVMSIGACTSFSYGLGEKFSTLKGSEATAQRENFGGIEGGISNGQTINFQVSFRAPSTVGEKAKQGRHDPCIVPRAMVVVESMVYIVLADHFLRQKTIP